VQRWFSTFPNNWPGAGLLLLRLTLAGGLFTAAWTELQAATVLQNIAAVGELLLGLLLIMGLWTPIVGIVSCLLEITLVVMAGRAMESSLMQAAIGVCLALLGPGAWSIDARLFGRKRVEITRLNDN
jgi:putative oxidoreductase